MERANGIRSAIQRGSYLVGAPVGGVLVAELGATTALWLDAASFVFAAALVAAAIPRPTRAAEPAAPSRYLSELAEGMRFIKNQPLFRAIVATVLLTNLLEAPFPVVMPVFAQEAYGSAADLGLLYGVGGGAGLVGSLVYGALGHRLPRRLTFLGSFAVIPLMYLALATLPSLPVALAVMAVAGLAGGPINPLLNTVQFELVPPEMRGRVFGAVKAGAWAAIPLGVLLGGVLVDVVGVAATFLGIGLCYVAVTVYGFFNPAFRELDHRERAPGGP
jgi:predicted MFS family arabinose efflux permease